MAKKKYKQVSLCIPTHLVENIDVCAIRDNRNRSSFVVNILTIVTAAISSGNPKLLENLTPLVAKK